MFAWGLHPADHGAEFAGVDEQYLALAGGFLFAEEPQAGGNLGVEEELAVQGDRVAMAGSIEGRYPYLDHTLIEFANRLPPSWKIRGLTEKYILRRALADLLPRDIAQRTKQPYRAPDSRARRAGGFGRGRAGYRSSRSPWPMATVFRSA